MNKGRRIRRRRGRRPFRYDDRHKTLAVRGMSDSWADSEDDTPVQALADDIIRAAHLRNRSVRSESIEDYSVYSIHLSPESVTSSKLAPESVQPVHLSFNPVQGITGLNILQQFGNAPFSFAEKQEVIHVTIPLQSSYRDEHYVMTALGNDPGFHVFIQTRRQQEAVIGITRMKDCLISEGRLSWIAIGETAQ